MEKKMRGFWNWFQAQEPRFRRTAALPTEELFQEAVAELAGFGVNIALEWHELEPRASETQQCELVLTANGWEPDFEAVETLCRLAPAIDGWKITAFKQADHFEFMTVYGDIQIDPDDCWFQAVPSKIDADKWAILVTVPGYEIGAQESYGPALNSMLVSGLGERVVARQIQIAYAIMPWPRPAEVDFKPLSQLADFLSAEWQLRSAKPALMN
jgi:hypothetical protein